MTGPVTAVCIVTFVHVHSAAFIFTIIDLTKILMYWLSRLVFYDKYVAGTVPYLFAAVSQTFFSHHTVFKQVSEPVLRNAD